MLFRIPRRLSVVLVLALGGSGACLAPAAPVYSQNPDGPECRGDANADRCAEALLRRSLEAYGVPPIEAHREAGDQVYRIFYYDTHRYDIALISFVRSPGRDPVVRVHYPSSRWRAGSEFIGAPVTQSTWDELARRSANFDRSFALEPGEDPALRTICVDGGSHRIETVSRARGRLPAEVRIDVESECEQGPGTLFAVEAARLALPLFAQCANLEPHDAGLALLHLRDCRVLRGDRLAAAEVYDSASSFVSLHGSADAFRLGGVFAHETVIDWAGERYSGPGYRADEFWVGRLQERTTNLILERIEGETADRARLTGILTRSADTPRGRSTGQEHARLEQIWVREGREMRLQSATISAWEAFRPQSRPD